MRHINLLIKPASGLCNMRCKYCFYADVADNREVRSYGIMTEETLECVITKALEYATAECTLAFQGGEPTVAGIDFFRMAVSMVKRLNTKKLTVHYALQTNGYTLDDEWAEFFAVNKFLIGLSLDGNKDCHDRYRLDAAGKGTYNTVTHAAQIMERHGVDYNLLTVVTADIAKNIGKIYGFYKKSGYRYQQYIPCIDPFGENHGEHEYSLTPERYGYFLKTLFDCWYNDLTRGEFVYNRYFENLVGMIMGQPPESCGLAGICSKQLVIEADGGVYPCDFYVLDKYLLGNLTVDSFARIEQRRNELGFVEQSRILPQQCLDCRWYGICRGGCRRDREQPDGSLGLNCYCESYKDFFSYSYERLVKLSHNLQ